MDTRASLEGKKAVVLFDGVCNLCNGAVDFIISRDKKDYFLFASLQSEHAKGIIAPHFSHTTVPDSILLWENNVLYTKSLAALRIAKSLPGAWPILYYIGILFPRVIRDAVYDFIARNRYRWFGKSATCRLPTEAERSKFL
ncbi:DCC1-like thiol-disulfide oxidoreductase family protein [Cytophagales bacterium LB-30]|uniref:DCC1-like thiol-disulfide oxidoreductase family protein n=1 Tax=Shiella aurantiaca TaxID=3058365 RepID=A0ABT8F4X8_9BACT|nr:DCC1-like thiol-disulfide oxidoreductase family protein [Shiella aurantiaca]MDN4165424.1 DCC1-like thiol-disulfide oxidoreductase family protein [Shiella aurantiaca]